MQLPASNDHEALHVMRAATRALGGLKRGLVCGEGEQADDICRQDCLTEAAILAEHLRLRRCHAEPLRCPLHRNPRRRIPRTRPHRASLKRVSVPLALAIHLLP